MVMMSHQRKDSGFQTTSSFWKMKATELCHFTTQLKEASTRAPTQLRLHSATHRHLTHILDYSLYLNHFICLPAAYAYPDTGNYLGLRSRLFQRARFYHCRCFEQLVHHDNKQKTDFGFTIIFLFSTDHAPLMADTQRGPPSLSISIYCHLCHFFTGLSFAFPLPLLPSPTPPTSGLLRSPWPQSLIPHLIPHQHWMLLKRVIEIQT